MGMHRMRLVAFPIYRYLSTTFQSGKLSFTNIFAVPPHLLSIFCLLCALLTVKRTFSGYSAILPLLNKGWCWHRLDPGLILVCLTSGKWLEYFECWVSIEQYAVTAFVAPPCLGGKGTCSWVFPQMLRLVLRGWFRESPTHKEARLFPKTTSLKNVFSDRLVDVPVGNIIRINTS